MSTKAIVAILSVGGLAVAGYFFWQWRKKNEAITPLPPGYGYAPVLAPSPAGLGAPIGGPGIGQQAVNLVVGAAGGACNAGSSALGAGKIGSLACGIGTASVGAVATTGVKALTSVASKLKFW